MGTCCRRGDDGPRCRRETVPCFSSVSCYLTLVEGLRRLRPSSDQAPEVEERKENGGDDRQHHAAHDEHERGLEQGDGGGDRGFDLAVVGRGRALEHRGEGAAALADGGETGDERREDAGRAERVGERLAVAYLV